MNYKVTCYRSLASGLSVPEVWISGQSRESADYHAWHGMMTESRERGYCHGPFRAVQESANQNQKKP